MKIELIQGDIIKIEVDAIVNAALMKRQKNGLKN